MDPRLTSLIDWIRAEAQAAKGLLVPISGGSDSAIVFWLCNQAYPEKTLGIYAGDVAGLRCREWFEKTGKVTTIPAPTTEDKEGARWTAFLSQSRAENRWLVGSRTRTEDVMGTFSLASRLATFLPIAGVWKSEVMALCNTIGVPAEITASSRRADPDCGRPKEMAEIPLEDIDRFLKVRVGELDASALALDDATRAYLEHVFQGNSFRTQLPKRGPQV